VTGIDHDLLERLRAGDTDAYGVLVERWSPSMLRVARAYVRTQQAAEDVVQETWLAVMVGLAQFEGRSSLRTWVFSILANRARTQGARAARTVVWSDVVRRDHAFDDDVSWQSHLASRSAPTVDNGNPERCVLDRELEGHVIHALVRLPARQALAVTYRDIVGLDAEESRRLMGVSAENYRVLLHRGRTGIRAAVRSYLAS
jgi:RNA polymerase sigma-70 factor, ECF subfamily